MVAPVAVVEAVINGRDCAGRKRPKRFEAVNGSKQLSLHFRTTPGFTWVGPIFLARSLLVFRQ